MISGERVFAHYETVNEGGSPLVISAIRTTCGCSAATLGKAVLEAGESGTIEMVLQTEGRIGPFSTAGDINSNDPVNPYTRIVLNVVIAEEPRAGQVIDFGQVRAGEPAERPVLVAKTAGASEQLVRIEGTTEWLQVEQPSSDPKWAASHFLRVRLLPAAPVGPLKHKLLLRTNSPTQPAIVLWVTGEVKGDIRVLPPTLDLRRARSGRGRVILLLERSAKKHQFTVESVSMSDPHLSAELREVRPGREVNVEVFVRAEGDLPAAEQSIIVRTDSPTARTIRIPVLLPSLGSRFLTGTAQQ